ncbi:Aste57867_16375 [Aphanomyces stellatus]|uniref:Aste57867_16375 protein n=1 Tax=Aphanomyces stellatus TaxID=120398 RepID=A0A485L5A9_9STRA|nr:hypothetical protein As57867_016318 [Aphanomyces stellatus]VFT93151.1 Aste57867_16375 [Aphanomyces stellatus]
MTSTPSESSNPGAAIAAASTERSPLVENVADDMESTPSVYNEVSSLARLAAPIIFTLFLEFIPGITNLILVGQMPISNLKLYVDAAAMASVYTNITSFSVGFGMATAMDTLCTQAYGAGNVKKFGILLQSALLGMALTLIPVALVNWFTADILHLLGQDPTLADLTGDFVRVLLVGYPALFCFEVLKKLLQAEGVTTPMAVMVGVGNVIHVGLGYALTQYSTLGYLGAPVALSLVEWMLVAFMVGYLMWVNPMHEAWQVEWSWAAAWSHVGQFFQFGVPGMLMMMIEWGAIELLTLVAGLMPNSLVTIGVNSILANTLNLAYMPYFGLSIAATIRMGNLLGANEPEKAKRVMFLTLRLCFGCAFASGLTIVLLSPVLPRLLINDTQIVQRGATALFFIVPLHIVDAMNAACQGCFRAMGKQDTASGVNAAAFYIVGVPVAVFCGLYLEWSVEGLWAGFTLGSLTAFVIYQILLTKIDWAQVAQEAIDRE